MLGIFLSEDEDDICLGICPLPERQFFGPGSESTPIAFQQIEPGYGTGCGITTGNAIVCWGNQSRRANSPPEGEYVDLSVGYSHACGLRTDEAVVCWAFERGEDSPGAGSQLFCLADDDGYVTCPGETEYEMTAMEQSGRVILWDVYSHHGTNYTCGYRLDATLVCWYEGTRSFIDPVPILVEAFTATDDNTFCWLLPDHTVACWGRIGTPEGTFRSISIGETADGVFACGIRTYGSLACWGNTYPYDWGQLDHPSGEYKAVSAAYGYTCAIKIDDTVVCWGNHNIRPTPDGTLLSIDGAGLLHCGVRTNHSVECWGHAAVYWVEGLHKSIGIGDWGGSYFCTLGLDGTLQCRGDHQTGRISPPAGRFESISAGGAHACAIRTDGTVACWSAWEESHGVPADETSPPQDKFRTVQVGGAPNHNSAFSCGIRTDGKLTCWGNPRSPVLKNLLENRR